MHCQVRKTVDSPLGIIKTHNCPVPAVNYIEFYVPNGDNAEKDGRVEKVWYCEQHFSVVQYGQNLV